MKVMKVKWTDRPLIKWSKIAEESSGYSNMGDYCDNKDFGTLAPSDFGEITYWGDIKGDLLERKGTLMKSFLDKNRTDPEGEEDLLREIDSIDSSLKRIDGRLEEIKGEESRRTYFV